MIKYNHTEYIFIITHNFLNRFLNKYLRYRLFELFIKDSRENFFKLKNLG